MNLEAQRRTNRCAGPRLARPGVRAVGVPADHRNGPPNASFMPTRPCGVH